MGANANCCSRENALTDSKLELTRNPSHEAVKKIQRSYRFWRLQLSIQRQIKDIIVAQLKTLSSVIFVDDNKEPYLNDTVTELLRCIKRIDAYCRKSRIFPNVKVINEDKSIYMGKMTSKLDRHGFGRIYYNDGSLFEGSFSQNEKKGYGRDIFSDGSYYEGEYKNSYRNGYGKFSNVIGNTSVGYWKDDYQHGHGSETFPDGSFFVGEYKMGLKDGRGKFIWSNKQQYEGEFKNDVIEGFGISQFPNGKIHKGYWVENRMCGLGEMLWTDGRVYYGNFEDDNRNGFGVFIDDMKEIKYTGFWKEGNFDGIGHMCKGGKEYFANWDNGTKRVEIEDENVEMILKKEVDELKKYFQSF